MSQVRDRKQVRAFLKKEAKTMYRTLSPAQQNLTTWQEIWRGLRKAWNAGSQVDDETVQAVNSKRYIPASKRGEQ